jgi:nicotinamidase-related amidase
MEKVMRVLLVIDVQKGFITKPHYRDLVDRLNKFLIENKYDKIIFAKFKNDKSKNPLYIDKIGWDKLTTKEEQDFAITVPKDTIIFEKYSYGLQKEQIEYIKSLGVDKIDICGLKSEACVYTISLQMFDNCIHPNILINYVEGDLELKETMKNIFIKQFGSIDERL